MDILTQRVPVWQCLIVGAAIFVFTVAAIGKNNESEKIKGEKSNSISQQPPQGGNKDDDRGKQNVPENDPVVDDEISSKSANNRERITPIRDPVHPIVKDVVNDLVITVISNMRLCVLDGNDGEDTVGRRLTSSDDFLSETDEFDDTASSNTPLGRSTQYCETDRPFSMRIYRVGDEEGREKFDICKCLDSDQQPATRRPSSSVEDGMSTPHSASMPLLKPLKRLKNITQELVQTEVTFVHDMSQLLTLLWEWRYSTIPRVHEFINSSAYVGLCSAVETIWRTNSLFLEQLKAPLELLDSPDTSNVLSMCEYVEASCRGAFRAFELCTSLFPLFSQFVVRHDDFTVHFTATCNDNAAFKEFVSTCEVRLGETTLSLVIKPVQRLPRYVLLCKEMRSTLERCLGDNVDPTGVLLAANKINVLSTLHGLCVEVSDRMANCVHQCNELVQVHQDAVRMHELHSLFQDGGTDVVSNKVVLKGRVIIKEGDLRRHHKHGGIKIHRVQLFSDALLSSSPYGKGLHLEQNISLRKHEDTLCYPIPTPHSGSPSTWFVVISDMKRLYFCAVSHDEMMRWVSAIHSTLLRNETDSDFYLMRHQVAIVNIMISEINDRRSLAEKQIDRSFSSSDAAVNSAGSSFADAYVEYSSSIQASWWQLADLLDSPFLSPASCSLLTRSRKNSTSKQTEVNAREGGDCNFDEREEFGLSDTSNLERVIDYHVNEVMDRIEMSIECAETDCVDGKSPIHLLLRDGCPHYLIAIGVFFEYPQEYSGSMESGDRPALLKLFLLHDVLIGAYIDKVNNRLHYSFSVQMENLECTDYREGVGDLAIVLADASRKSINKRKGSLFRSVESHSRLLYAPSVDLKFDWLSLMMQTVAAFKRIGPVAPIAASEKCLSPKSYLKSIPLQELNQSIVGSAWTTRDLSTTFF